MNSIYALKNIDSIRNKSSSGGAFLAFAQAFYSLHKNGIVFGVEIIGTKISYGEANTFKDCFRFQESKYVRASVSGIYDKIVKYLKSETPVMFVGVPCQVAGLKRYLANNNVDTKMFYTIDLICHGTGRSDVWDKYVCWIEKKYKSSIDHYSFRAKQISWDGYPVYIRFANGKVLLDTYDARVYIRLFFKKYIMNTSCYACKFKSIHREGDLTIGDFWGIKSIHPQAFDDKGVSLVLVNDRKGKDLLEVLKKEGEITLLEVTDKSGWNDCQDNLKGNYSIPDERKEFLEDLKELSFSELIKKYNIYTLKGKIRAFIIEILQILHIKEFIKNLLDKT